MKLALLTRIRLDQWLHTPPTLQNYLGRQIGGAVLFVLASFVALFAFFDFVHEIGDLGVGTYHLREILAYVVLAIPARAYELVPVAVLIGAMYALAQLASHSEFTVMRAAGLSPAMAARILLRVGLPFVVLTFILGEGIAPFTEREAQAIKVNAKRSMIGQQMKSGLWFKDGRTFINVGEAGAGASLNGISIYEFDASYRLMRVSAAKRAEYLGDSMWRLTDIRRTTFAASGPQASRAEVEDLRSALSPELLNVLIVDPERMSAWRLYKYIEHLSGNRQKTERYEIAFWKKIWYPFAILVMMALALPFAYLHARAGLVGVKVFLGILLGIFFYMLNSLFSHVGLLQHWPPIASAIVPSVAFLFAAMAMMWWVERR